MEATGKHSLDVAKNVSLSCVLCFITGSLYSLGVFSEVVEEAADPPESLDGVWSAGMALISFCCIPFMFITGVYLSEGSDSMDYSSNKTSKSVRARQLSGLGSCAYSLLALAGLGVTVSSPVLIQLSFAPVGMAMGLFYVESMELMAVWVPHRPGLAVGVGQMMFGIGSIVSSSVFEYLVNNFSTSNALYITASFLALPAAAVTPFIDWAPLEYLDAREADESDELLQRSAPLSWQQLVHLTSFWMYVITIFCLQAGYAFIAYYFVIGQSFGKDLSTLVSSFQTANMAGTLLRPLTGALVDILKTRDGFFSIGSKNIILILLLGQTIAFLGLVPSSWTNWYQGYGLFAGTAIAIFASGSCCAPLLAREQFGAVNSSVVFGVGGSISMGLGETAAVLMMAAVEWSSVENDVPSQYQNYYILSVVWSLIGGITCILLKRLEEDNVVENGRSANRSYCHLDTACAERQMWSTSCSSVMTGCGSYASIDGTSRGWRGI